MPRGGTPPLVPMWPEVRAVNYNPFPFFPFNPRWGEPLPEKELDTFCALLRLAWISQRPCYLPASREDLMRLLEPALRRGCMEPTDHVLSFFQKQPQTGLIYFPPQLRALSRLVSGEDLYALLWDAEM